MSLFKVRRTKKFAVPFMLVFVESYIVHNGRLFRGPPSGAQLEKGFLPGKLSNLMGKNSCKDFLAMITPVEA